MCYCTTGKTAADEVLSGMLYMLTPRSSIMFYAETPVGPPLKKVQMLLFIKYFDIETQTLRYSMVNVYSLNYC